MTAEHPPAAFDDRRVLVVSPHFDDAVLSCGHVLAAAEQAVVVTVFAATPARYPDPPTAWDRLCGFSGDDDVMAVRRRENDSALAELGVVSTELDFVDHQYRAGRTVRVADVALQLADAVRAFDPTTVVVPFGLQHADHRTVSRASLQVRERGDQRAWIGYLELPYAWWFPDVAARRIARAQLGGVRVTPVFGFPACPFAKARALGCYASQIDAWGWRDSIATVAHQPELLWSLTDRPPLALSALRRAVWTGRDALARARASS